MTTREVATMIESIGVPFAYYQFPDNTEQKTPFICFYYPGNNDFVADGTNYVHVNQLIIELYTDNKNFTLEDTIKSTLSSNGLVYVWDSAYLDDEHMYMTTFTMEVLIDG